jgi:hypothetical protein
MDANPPPAAKKSSGVLQGVLIGCGILVLLVVGGIAIGGYLLYRSVSTDPARVESVAKEILNFETPAGYRGVFATSVAGFKSAVFQAAGGPDPNAMIAIMSIPSDKADPEATRRKMDEQMKAQGQKREVVEQRADEPFKVRGKESPGKVQVMKGRDEAGRVMQYTFVTEGKAGESVVIIIAGGEKELDHAAVQKFLDSIK